LCLSIKSFLQNPSFQNQYQLRVLKTETFIKIDGEPNEPIGQKAVEIGGFGGNFLIVKTKHTKNNKFYAWTNILVQFSDFDLGGM
jgi:hypothetical protein